MKAGGGGGGEEEQDYQLFCFSSGLHDLDTPLM